MSFGSKWCRFGSSVLLVQQLRLEMRLNDAIASGGLMQDLPRFPVTLSFCRKTCFDNSHLAIWRFGDLTLSTIAFQWQTTRDARSRHKVTSCPATYFCSARAFINAGHECSTAVASSAQAQHKCCSARAFINVDHACYDACAHLNE